MAKATGAATPPAPNPWSIVVPPTETWQGLAVVDFRDACDTIYVLRLNRPVDRLLDAAVLLASLREGVVPRDLDAKLEVRGFLGPFVYPTAFLSPMTSEDYAKFRSVYPGGHFDWMSHGEGSVLAGTFRHWGPQAPFHHSYVVESTAATLASSGGVWFPFDARFILVQSSCD